MYPAGPTNYKFIIFLATGSNRYFNNFVFTRRTGGAAQSHSCSGHGRNCINTLNIHTKKQHGVGDWLNELPI